VVSQAITLAGQASGQTAGPTRRYRLAGCATGLTLAALTLAISAASTLVPVLAISGA